jgi:hypothetical protein
MTSTTFFAIQPFGKHAVRIDVRWGLHGLQMWWRAETADYFEEWDAVSGYNFTIGWKTKQHGMRINCWTDCGCTILIHITLYIYISLYIILLILPMAGWAQTWCTTWCAPVILAQQKSAMTRHNRQITDGWDRNWGHWASCFPKKDEGTFLEFLYLYKLYPCKLLQPSVSSCIQSLFLILTLIHLHFYIIEYYLNYVLLIHLCALGRINSSRSEPEKSCLMSRPGESVDGWWPRSTTAVCLLSLSFA